MLYPQVETQETRPVMAAAPAEKPADVVQTSIIDVIEKKDAGPSPTAPPLPDSNNNESNDEVTNVNSNHVGIDEESGAAMCCGCPELRVGLMVFMLIGMLMFTVLTASGGLLNLVMVAVNAIGLYAVWRRSYPWLRAFNVLYLVGIVLLAIVAALLFVGGAVISGSRSDGPTKQIEAMAYISGAIITGYVLIGIYFYTKLKEYLRIVRREHEHVLPK